MATRCHDCNAHIPLLTSADDPALCGACGEGRAGRCADEIMEAIETDNACSLPTSERTPLREQIKDIIEEYIL